MIEPSDDGRGRGHEGYGDGNPPEALERARDSAHDHGQDAVVDKHQDDEREGHHQEGAVDQAQNSVLALREHPHLGGEPDCHEHHAQCRGKQCCHVTP